MNTVRRLERADYELEQLASAEGPPLTQLEIDEITRVRHTLIGILYMVDTRRAETKEMLYSNPGEIWNEGIPSDEGLNAREEG